MVEFCYKTALKAVAWVTFGMEVAGVLWAFTVPGAEPWAPILLDWEPCSLLP